jgi:hypothetical protein
VAAGTAELQTRHPGWLQVPTTCTSANVAPAASVPLRERHPGFSAAVAELQRVRGLFASRRKCKTISGGVWRVDCAV